MPAITRRRRLGANGCCARWPAARISCRSCTASAASGGSTEWAVPMAARLREFRAGAHRQCRAHPASARRVRRDHGRASSGAARRTFDQRIRLGRADSRFSSISRRSGSEPDQGIWEMRGPPQHFTYSKVMAWVAFDRAIKSAETFGLEGPIDEWRKLRERDLRRRLRARLRQGAAARSCRPTARSSSTPACCCCPASAFCRCPIRASRAPSRRSSAGCCATASSCATAPTRSRTRCRPAKARSWPAASGWSTSTCCRSASTRPNGCSGGWSACATIVGLLSEEYDPRAKRLVGNFPQAFSHLALVNSAYNLTRDAKAGAPARPRRARAARRKWRQRRIDAFGAGVSAPTVACATQIHGSNRCSALAAEIR